MLSLELTREIEGERGRESEGEKSTRELFLLPEARSLSQSTRSECLPLRIWVASIRFHSSLAPFYSLL